MNDHYYIGLDIHKKSITFVIKTKEGELVRQGRVEATHPALTAWAVAIDRPWIGALEATMFSGWVYDELRSRAQRLDVAHPLMLKAITCSKKKNDSLGPHLRFANTRRATGLPITPNPPSRTGRGVSASTP